VAMPFVSKPWRPRRATGGPLPPADPIGSSNLPPRCRLPVARLAAAQAAIEEKGKAAKPAKKK